MMDSSKRQDDIGGSRLFCFYKPLKTPNRLRNIPVLILPHISITKDLLPWKVYEGLADRDLPDFIDLLAHFDKSPKDLERLAKYGVNRADDRLWETYDWFQQRFNEEEPVRGGLFDLNRYYYHAR